MAKSYTEKFLDEYKKLEALLRAERGPDASVRDLEEELPSEADRLRYCRQTRNFVSHSADAFPVPKEAAEYVSEVRISLERRRKTAAQCASKIAPVTHQDTLQTAAKRLLAHPVLPIVDDGNILIGYMPRDSLLILFAGGEKPTTKIRTKHFIENLDRITVSGKTAFSDIEWKDRDVLIVVNDNGKYCGVMFR